MPKNSDKTGAIYTGPNNIQILLQKRESKDFPEQRLFSPPFFKNFPEKSQKPRKQRREQPKTQKQNANYANF